jgi:FkbM family methyltransferase
MAGILCQYKTSRKIIIIFVSLGFTFMRIRKRVLSNPVVFTVLKHLGVKQFFGQNKEDKTIADYFGIFKGTLLSVGENDGTTFSNVFYFILRGWKADLVEPSTRAYRKLCKLHSGRPEVHIHKIAIGAKTEESVFFDSGELEGIGDTSLVSTLNSEEIKKWPQTQFSQTTVSAYSFQDFMDSISCYKKYDLISIDAESMDYTILSQVDLGKLGCRCVIVEFGGSGELRSKMSAHCAKYGLYLSQETPENLIFTKKTDSPPTQ